MKFKYKPNDAMVTMIRNNIETNDASTIIGILDDGYVNQHLNKFILYLACESYFVGKKAMYKNPMAIVALNQQDAARIYYEETGKPASIMCEFEHNASKAEVLPY